MYANVNLTLVIQDPVAFWFLCLCSKEGSQGSADVSIDRPMSTVSSQPSGTATACQTQGGKVRLKYQTLSQAKLQDILTMV